MKNIWSLVCQSSSNDAETNTVSLFNCVDEITFEIDPMENENKFSTSLRLVSLWLTESKTEDSLDFKLEIIDPDKKNINVFQKKYSFKKGSPRFRNTVNLIGLPITKSGRYTFVVMEKPKNKKSYNKVSEIPIDIHFKQSKKINE